MAPGLNVKVKQEWRHAYRKPGVELEGVLIAVSPTGTIARVRMDDLGDSYLWMSHLEPAGG